MLTATMRRFTIALADADRGVYDELDLRVAQHPSESERYLVARVIARALEHDEGVVFTKGLDEADEPAIWQRDLRGDLQAWIEIGAPSPERLHKASKLGARIAVYGWQRLDALARELAEQEVHRAEEMVLRALEPQFLDEVAATLDRNNKWELSVSGGALYLSAAGKSFESAVRTVPVAA